jgi:hypothetical protein
MDRVKLQQALDLIYKADKMLRDTLIPDHRERYYEIDDPMWKTIQAIKRIQGD